MDDELQQPQLKFTQEGNDLVIAAVVSANNSPHILWTRVYTFRAKVIPNGGRLEDAREEHRISLHYYVFQNRDLYMRSLKDIEVIWRMPGHKRGSEEYRIVRTFDPDSDELKQLLPKMEALAKGDDCR